MRSEEERRPLPLTPHSSSFTPAPMFTISHSLRATLAPMMRRVLPCLLVLALASCATPQPPPASSATPSAAATTTPAETSVERVAEVPPEALYAEGVEHGLGELDHSGLFVELASRNAMQ